MSLLKSTLCNVIVNVVYDSACTGHISRTILLPVRNSRKRPTGLFNSPRMSIFWKYAVKVPITWTRLSSIPCLSGFSPSAVFSLMAKVLLPLDRLPGFNHRSSTHPSEIGSARRSNSHKWIHIVDTKLSCNKQDLSTKADRISHVISHVHVPRDKLEDQGSRWQTHLDI